MAAHKNAIKARVLQIADTLIETAKLNGVVPQARLAHVLANIADQEINKRDELMPWNFVPA